MPSSEKATKEHVNYRKAKGNRRCGNCWMYQPKNHACLVVKGVIDSEDVCKWHEYPKEKKK